MAKSLLPQDDHLSSNPSDETLAKAKEAQAALEAEQGVVVESDVEEQPAPEVFEQFPDEVNS